MNLAIAQETASAGSRPSARRSCSPARPTTASRSRSRARRSPRACARSCSCRSTTTPTPTGPRDGPGAETYFQIASPESKRAAGLVYEELVDAFAAYDIAWVGDRDAGAKYRPRADGTDYYGILHRSAGVPAVLVGGRLHLEPARGGPARRPGVPGASRPRRSPMPSSASSRPTTPAAASSTPYPRTEPAGPGGGATAARTRRSADRPGSSGWRIVGCSVGVGAGTRSVVGLGSGWRSLGGGGAVGRGRPGAGVGVGSGPAAVGSAASTGVSSTWSPRGRDRRRDRRRPPRRPTDRDRELVGFVVADAIRWPTNTIPMPPAM